MIAHGPYDSYVQVIALVDIVRTHDIDHTNNTCSVLRLNELVP